MQITFWKKKNSDIFISISLKISDKIKWFMQYHNSVPRFSVYMYIWRVCECATRKGQLFKRSLLRELLLRTSSAVQCIHFAINILLSQEWNYVSRLEQLARNTRIRWRTALKYIALCIIFHNFTSRCILF